jgi:hypothetical protein
VTGDEAVQSTGVDREGEGSGRPSGAVGALQGYCGDCRDIRWLTTNWEGGAPAPELGQVGHRCDYCGGVDTEVVAIIPWARHLALSLLLAATLFFVPAHRRQLRPTDYRDVAHAVATGQMFAGWQSPALIRRAS